MTSKESENDPSRQLRAERHPFHTPILDLLLGSKPFNLQDRPSVVESIMGSLSSRVTTNFIGAQLLQGNSSVKTKSTLKKGLARSANSVMYAGNPVKSRKNMEDKLIPWVVENVSAFPELWAEPFLFIHMLLVATCVLDIVCDPHTSMAQANAPVVKKEICDALNRRGIDQYTTMCGSFQITLHAQLNGILGDNQHGDVIKRGYVEKVLRYIAFAHRHKFPGMKFSLLVKTWERGTGQKW
ncbi:hypothetical protein CC86DRAFT_91391 [Ophiobolus disseminans]|uniref:Uncharacterized protein n=1 Tax=Ophiobolus disseminans TaxID=1469910 RepID=A0A6A7AIT3_9PLEO|nr:hypothetical protein CC86DRAFT_91391 [Ophiobolus disseminans]